MSFGCLLIGLLPNWKHLRSEHEFLFDLRKSGFDEVVTDHVEVVAKFDGSSHVLGFVVLFIDKRLIIVINTFFNHFAFLRDYWALDFELISFFRLFIFLLNFKFIAIIRLFCFFIHIHYIIFCNLHWFIHQLVPMRIIDKYWLVRWIHYVWHIDFFHWDCGWTLSNGNLFVIFQTVPCCWSLLAVEVIV